jgi:hypothetical protein
VPTGQEVNKGAAGQVAGAAASVDESDAVRRKRCAGNGRQRLGRTAS